MASNIDTSMSNQSYQRFQVQNKKKALRANINALQKDWEPSSDASIIRDAINEDYWETDIKISDIDFILSYQQSRPQQLISLHLL